MFVGSDTQNEGDNLLFAFIEHTDDFADILQSVPCQQVFVSQLCVFILHDMEEVVVVLASCRYGSLHGNHPTLFSVVYALGILGSLVESSLLTDSFFHSLTYRGSSKSDEPMAVVGLKTRSSTNHTDIPLADKVVEVDTLPDVVFSDVRHKIKVGADKLVDSLVVTILYTQREFFLLLVCKMCISIDWHDLKI